jgi:diguanylate cyclase (GGDEF)-like protein
VSWSAPALAGAGGSESLLERGLDKILDILRLDGGWVAIGRDVSLELARSRGISDRCAAAMAAVPNDAGVAGRAFTARETVIVGDTATNPLVPPALLDEGIRTMLLIPLVTHGGALGVLALMTRRPRVYSTDEVGLAVAAGAELASAVEHILFREQLDRIDRQRLLLEATETVNRSVDSASLETIILAEATRLVDAQKSALLTVRGDVLVAKEVYRLRERDKQLFVVPLEGSLFGRVVQTGETAVVEDVGTAGGLGSPAGEGGEGGYRALLAAPLQSYRGTYGALAVFYDHARQFREYEKTLFRTFAIHATIALDNRRLIQEKDQMAVRDGLTGVYNRSYLELTLERTTKEVRRNGGVASVLFLDLDDMKKVNDTYGHQLGDRLLRELAGLLEESCRETDIVARYGGDEFVVLMPGTDESGARHVALKVDEGIARHNAAAEGPVRLSASMGVHTAGGADINDLLLEADRRMYAMKRTRAGESED